MQVTERAVVFPCGEDALIGVVTTGEQVLGTGVLIIVGGPQYRVGSHRQFVRLARYLARHGVPCMRFDYRGMGDSTGVQRSFASVDDDVRAAIEVFAEAVPGLGRVVLWGLCDGASAACLALRKSPLIAGAVLLNPWVRTKGSQAGVMLRHYYLRRVADPRFWRKLLRGNVSLSGAVGSLLKTLSGRQGRAATGKVPALEGAGRGQTATVAEARPPHLADVPHLPERMLECLTQSGLPLAVFLSGRDFVAREFEQVVLAEPRWQRLMQSPSCTSMRFESADHTFSRREDAEAVEQATLQWLISERMVEVDSQEMRSGR